VKAGRGQWIGLAVLALPTLLVTMDLSVLFLAVPKLTRDLEPTTAQLLWIADIYGFLIAACLIMMGTLGDRIGRRRLLLIGAAAFAVASLVAAFSTSAPMLIVARAGLGVAAATLAPSSLALIRNMFEDDQQRTLAISIWISCFAAGAAVGPLVGGALLEHFWWGSVFLPNVPVMVLLLLLGPRLLPESRDPNPGRLDLWSASMSLASVLAIIYGITRIAERGADAAAAGSIVVGLAIGAVFLRRQGRLAYPLVDLRLFSSPAFVVAFSALLVSVFVISGSDLFIAQYLQLVHGISPFVAGLWLLPGVIALIVGSMLAPWFTGRFAAGLVVAVGLILATAGLVVLALLKEDSTLAVLVTGTTLLGLGIGPVGALGTDIVVTAAPAERAGAASALSETATEFGGALGIAILGSIGTAVYRHALSDDVPEGVPTHAADAARDTLGGAVQAAVHLPGKIGDQLVGAATASFTQGFEIAVVVGAAVSAIVALAAVLALRTATVEGEEASPSARGSPAA
jgi:MFS transporter, DHA2 family, multidrug resistance protein